MTLTIVSSIIAVALMAYSTAALLRAMQAAARPQTVKCRRDMGRADRTGYLQSCDKLSRRNRP